MPHRPDILPVRGTGPTFDRKCKESIPQLIELLRDSIYFTVFFAVFKGSRQKYFILSGHNNNILVLWFKIITSVTVVTLLLRHPPPR